MADKKFVLLLFICFSLFGCNQPEPVERDPLQSIPDPKTLNEGYVSNPDHLLSEATVADLNARLGPLDQAGVAHIDVVFVNSIGDRVPKDIATALFRKWKIGDQQKDNGLLILMVKDQRRVEFETGYGLEGPLPDMLCYRIQQEYMVPYAKEGDYDFAVKSGVEAVLRQLQTGKYDPSPQKTIGDPVAGTIDSKAITTLPEAVAPIIAAQDFSSSETQDNPSPKQIGGWPSLIILIIYGVAVAKISGDINPDGRIKFSDPLLWLLLLVPVGSILLLDYNLPVSWMEVRQVILLYFFLTLFISVYYGLLGRKLSRSLVGLSHYQQHLKWYDTHARMEWASKIFPLFSLYWSNYQKRLKNLRDAPLSCTTCSKDMVRLGEDQEDHHLSQGQRTEEQIESVDYDVWECGDCKQKVVLNYRNVKSKAKECSKCHHRTLIYQKKVIVESATTYSEGRGYKLSVCKNCNYHHKDEFSIPRISTSSGSSSSSSPSSSSSSTSSGGSSGGGGAGSSW